MERDAMATADTTEERWLPVPGYEGMYEVSDHGRVRSLTRRVPDGKGGERWSRGRGLRTAENGSGHHFVSLFRTGSDSKRFVHRLVLEAFVGPCPPGHEGCHTDGNPANNHVGNLRWGTASDNRLDSVRHGTHQATRRRRCPRGHVLTDPNLVPTQKARGSRSCLACARARSYLRYHPELRGKESEVFDRYYAAIFPKNDH